MASLDIALAELEGILTEVQSSKKLETPGERVKLVVETRSRVVKKIAEINQFIGSDERLQANADLARQFTEKLTVLRHTLAALQSKWRTTNLAEDFQGYAAESRISAQGCLDFVRWARAARTG